VTAFADEEIAAIVDVAARSLDPKLECEYLSERRAVRLVRNSPEGKTSLILTLVSLFSRISSLPREQWHEKVRSMLRQVLSLKGLLPDVLLESLKFQVRTRFFLEQRRSETESMGGHEQAEILLPKGSLYLEVVADLGDWVASARADMLDDIGINEDEAIQYADAAIRRIIDGDPWEEVEKGVWLSRYRDSFDFARLVSAAEDMRYPFQGVPTVFCPVYSTCLITNSTERNTIAKMINVGNQLSIDQEPFSQMLWTMAGDGKWTEWRPVSDIALQRLAATQGVLETCRQYNSMRGRIQEIKGRHFEVAEVLLVEECDMLAICSMYLIDRKNCIPRTDLVGIADSARSGEDFLLRVISWKELEERLAETGLKPIAGVHPEWFYIDQPLSLEARERLVGPASQSD